MTAAWRESEHGCARSSTRISRKPIASCASNTVCHQTRPQYPRTRSPICNCIRGTWLLEARPLRATFRSSISTFSRGARLLSGFTRTAPGWEPGPRQSGSSALWSTASVLGVDEVIPRRRQRMKPQRKAYAAWVYTCHSKYPRAFCV